MRMIVRKKKKSHIILKLIMIIIICVFCAFFLIKKFSNNVKPGLIIYANDEVTRLVTLIINDSINNEMIEEFDEEKIFDVIRNDEGEIQLISYDTKNLNILLNSIAVIVQNNLEAIENGDVEFLDLSDSYFNEFDKDLLKECIICEIPFGSFSNSSLISNIGPKIPVKITLIGDVATNLISDVKEYGINNALLEVSIEIIVNFRVNLPFISEKITVSNELPISVKIIQGSIPNFYTGGFQSSFGIVK